MFSARELKDAGLPKRRIRQAVIEYHSKLLEKGMGALEEVSSDENSDEEPATMQQDGADLEPGGGGAVEIPAGVETAVVETAVVNGEPDAQWQMWANV